MKIRIRGNSVRIRITKSELEIFEKVGFLDETTEFANSTFGYSLQMQPGIDNLQADFKDQTLTVYIPVSMKEEWIKNDVVGFNHNLDIGNGKTLFLLVEKDYACIDNSLEDQSDNFMNPNAVC